MLAENHSLNPEIRARFIAEGRSLRKVNDPHVVTVHDIGESERQQPYLVLEYADRGTLADRVEALRAGGWVASAEDVLAASRNLASALHAVHAAGLVHRDLSPRNVLITRADRASTPPGGNGEPRLLAEDEILVVADLGMCKDLALNSGLTVAGGTAGFRPPEQDGPGVVDTRADLWAMSTLLRWLCEGAADLPSALHTALARSTAHDPEDRHPDVAAWLADVEASLAPPAVTPPGPAAGDAPTPLPQSRRRRALLGAVALVLAALLGGVGGVGLAGGLGTPDRAAGAAVAVDGPTRVAVGEEAIFTAVVEGVESWVWTMPDGTHVVDLPSVSTTARSPGSGRLVLRARAPDGADLEVVHTLTVTE